MQQIQTQHKPALPLAVIKAVRYVIVSLLYTVTIAIATIAVTTAFLLLADHLSKAEMGLIFGFIGFAYAAYLIMVEGEWE